MTSLGQIYSLLDHAPHRLNDLHVEYLLQCLDQIQQDRDYYKQQLNEVLERETKHSKAMLGNILGTMLNKPELLAKE